MVSTTASQSIMNFKASMACTGPNGGGNKSSSIGSGSDDSKSGEGSAHPGVTTSQPSNLYLFDNSLQIIIHKMQRKNYLDF